MRQADEHQSVIYLDHAATSWPKDSRVLALMDQCARTLGAAGRSSHTLSTEANRVIEQARRAIANLINAQSPSSISLQPSGTMALNAAILGLLQPNDHVVTTAAEHNSVLRPLHELEKSIGINVTTVACDEYGLVDANAILDAVRSDTRMVAVTHASNVTGAVVAIENVASGLAGSPTLLLVDAAQTVGTIPIDVQSNKIDLLAAPGHKGIGGPLGTGFLYVAPSVQGELRPTIFGGTGTISESLEMPVNFPGKLEAGNLNVSAIAGLAEAARLHADSGFGRKREWAAKLSKQMHDLLNGVPGVRIVSKPGPLPLLSLASDTLGPSDLAAILDANFGIACRAGFHCAAKIHAFLGTAQEGTLRLSAGESTTDDEVQSAYDAIASVFQEVHRG